MSPDPPSWSVLPLAIISPRWWQVLYKTLCVSVLRTAINWHTCSHFRDGSKEKYVDPSSQPLIPSKPSAEAFSLEHGRLRVGGGLRTSRSYDLITDAVKEDEKAAKEEERDGEQSQPTPSHVHSYSLPYGASPRCIIHVHVHADII